MSYVTKDDADLIGVQRILSLSYMKILRRCLQILRAWPGKILGEKESKFFYVGKVYIFLITLICLPPSLVYLKSNIGVTDFVELGHTYVTILINAFSVCRLALIFRKKYEILVADFINKIHLFNHKDGSEYALSTHVRVHRMSRFYTIYVNVVTVFGVVLFNFTPIYKNIKSGAFSNYKTENVTFEHSVYYELPFDCRHNINGYSVVFVFNWYVTYICSSCFLTFDTLMSLMVFHIRGHILIIINNLENFRRPLNELKADGIDCSMYCKEEMKLVSNDLRSIIIHYNLITEFTKRMSELFGYILFLYYMFHLVVGCVLLLECSQMNIEAMGRYGILTFVLFQQLIQISIVFELLGISSDKLNDAVYCIPWECMDKSNRKMVHIILINSQRSLSIKAMGMINVGVQTMVLIIRTSFSYFIMLRTFAEPEY